MSSKTNSFSTQQWARLQSIFEQALEVDVAQRQQLVKRVCDGDKELESQALSLIKAAESEQELVSDLIRTAADQVLETNQRTRNSIGSFKVIDVIGTGGMGVVYLAQRDDDEFHQRVAIKILHDDLASEESQLRFKTERQILADLNHPNIARLLDGGHTEDGQPYLVMEYVDGDPIIDYCDRHRLSIDERIDLFKQICSAVAAAHRSLVVHRDIKPSNILVGKDGVPKLLDFGIAKVLSNRLRDVDLAKTQLGDRLLTPDCASPEQVQGLPVTTASDIYSLGVLLYQLLCGRRPFQLADKTPAEMERIVIDDEPPLPSHSIGVLSSQDATSQEFSARRRGTTADKLARKLRGELDTIVMMALKKEPQRRFASASQFAADLTRYQSGMPVYAVRETPLYHASKAIQRNKLAAGALGLLIAALGVFSVSSSIQARDLARERDVSQNSLDFMIKVFDSSNPYFAQRSDLSARDILERGAESIDYELKHQPAVRAFLQRAIGSAYAAIESHDRALEILEPALATSIELYGDDHPHSADAFQAIGTVYRNRGQVDKAIQNYSKVLSIWDNRKSRKFFKRQPGKRLRAKLGTITALIWIRSLKLEFNEVDRLYRLGQQVAPLIADQPLYAHQEAFFLEAYGKSLQSQSRYRDSLPIFERALSISKRVNKTDHIMTAGIQAAMGASYLSLGEMALAGEMLQQSNELFKRLYNPDERQRLSSDFFYARFLARNGQEEKAATLLQEVLDVRKTIPLGNDDRGYYLTLLELMSVYLRLGEIELAEPVVAEGLIKEHRLREEGSAILLEFYRQHANYYALTKQPDKSIARFDQAIDLAVEGGLESGWQVGAYRSEKADVLMGLQRWSEAADELVQALQILEPITGKKHRLYIETMERAELLAQHSPEFAGKF